MPSYLPRIALPVPAFLGAVLIVLAAQPREATGATFNVTTNADSGVGSLREAIVAANGSAGFDTIDFDAGAFPIGNPATIMLSTPLPASTDPAGLEIDGTGAGVILDGSSTVSIGLIFHTASGIDLANVAIINLTVQNFVASGIRICGGVSLSCSQAVTGTRIQSVNASMNGQDGIEIVAKTVDDTEIMGCEASTNSRNGLRFTTSQDLTNTTVTGCTASNNGSDGFDAEVAGSITNFALSSCVANGNGSDGVEVESELGQTALTFGDCTTSGNTQHGFRVKNDASGDVTDLRFDSVTANNNGGAGLNPQSPNGSFVRLTISDSKVSGNGSSGVHANGGDGPAIDVSVSNTEANLNGGDGFNIDSNFAISGMQLSQSSFDDNMGDGIDIITQTMLDNLQITECSADGNGADGMDIDSDTGMSDVTIDNCSTSSNSAEGIRINGSPGGITDVTIRRVVANDNGSAGMNPQGDLDHMTRLTIEDSEASRNGSSGIHANGHDGDIVDVKIERVTAVGNMGSGLNLDTAGGVGDVSGLVSESTFVGNGSQGVLSEGSPTLRFNRIFGNGTGVEHLAGGGVDAENNWWGCNEGPNAPDCDTSAGNVDGDPWLVMTFEADPASIPGGGESALTADFTMNSDGTDTSAQGQLPDGTGVSFTTDFASIGSQLIVKETSQGAAEATLTADEGPGTANVSAILDNETQAGTVDITSAPPTPGPTATASPSPTDAPEPGLLQGDVDCDGNANSVDGLKVLLDLAGLQYTQGQGCPEIGEEVASLFGDVDCDDDVNSIDALKILQSVGEIPFTKNEPCADIGEALAT